MFRLSLVVRTLFYKTEQINVNVRRIGLQIGWSLLLC